MHLALLQLISVLTSSIQYKKKTKKQKNSRVYDHLQVLLYYFCSLIWEGQLYLHNRYHPEATVLETYRLYELNFHLQLIDQLPIGGTIDITAYTESTPSHQIDLEDDGQQSSSHCQGYPSVLGLHHIEELNRLYIYTYPECRNAVEQEEKEPGHGLTSTGASLSNCVGLSEKITQGPSDDSNCTSMVASLS